MRQEDLHIVGGSKFGRYPKISIENTYNMIVSDNALVPYAGYKIAAKIQGSGEGREIFRSISYDHLIVVIGPNVYTVTNALGYNKIYSQLETDAGPIYVTENGKKFIVFVDGTENIYIFNHETGDFTKTSTGPLGFRPTYITFQDGYFIIADGNSNEWRLSAPNDPTTWPIIEGTGELETKGDRPIAVVQFKRRLFVMGSAVTEIWHDIGNTLFPYQRDNSIAINYGVLSPQSIAAEFDIVVWLAQNKSAGPTIVVSRGGEVSPIATDGIEFFLDILKNPEESSGFLFEENGHLFYQLTFQRDNVSITYDFDTEKFYTLTDEKLDAHIAKRASFFNGKNYFVSDDNANLYEFSTQINKYEDKQIPRIRITKPFRMNDSSRFIVDNVRLTMDQGVSNELQRVLLSVSKDGGQSFGNIVSKDLNPRGSYANRVIFWNIGSANDITFKFQFWSGDRDPVASDSNKIFEDTVNSIERFVIISGMLELRT